MPTRQRLHHNHNISEKKIILISFIGIDWDIETDEKYNTREWKIKEKQNRLVCSKNIRSHKQKGMQINEIYTYLAFTFFNKTFVSNILTH